ncbi:TcpD family membrane protein [Streptococcus entericus]|uniref:TcpD family membrane protein n=1 Tax=Streptococcus entericus TaxID=155680 RepID=UPI00037AF2A3|nr:TcpD family membrane protein [Streptococcus entericus]
MTLQSLFEWFVNNIGVWIVAGFAGWKTIEAVRDQRIGRAITAVAIGGATVYFLNNPTNVLNTISEIFSNVFS